MIFVIGNGESRRGIDLSLLKDRGKTYGCNALYRDFCPDYLISMDTDMVAEIISSGYCKNNQCFFSEWSTFPKELYDNFQYTHFGNETEQAIHIGEKDKGKEFSIFGGKSMYIVWIDGEKIESFSNSNSFDAGANAIKLATEHNSDKETIYLLGFDMKKTEEGKNNNIYKDTKCYSTNDSEMTNTEKWINENKSIMENNPSVLYCRVDNTIRNPKEWDDLDNVRCISYKEFSRIIK